MQIYCGTDIIEVSRIEDAVRNTKGFKENVYTKNEIENIDKIRSNMKYQRYAGRFAAKEAIFKAVSELLDDKFEISWKDAEVLDDVNGKPRIAFTNKKLEEKIESIDISISHCKEYAVANVVIIAFER